MSVARITMVDYISEEVGDAFEVQAKEVFPKDIHQAIFTQRNKILILIRTGPLSGMSVAIYKDQKTQLKKLTKQLKHAKRKKKVILQAL